MWRVVGVRLHALGDTLAMRERRPRCVRGDEAGAASQHVACIGDATTNVAGTRAHPRMTRQPLRRPVRTRPRTGVGPSGRKAPRQLSSFGGARCETERSYTIYVYNPQNPKVAPTRRRNVRREQHSHFGRMPKILIVPFAVAHARLAAPEEEKASACTSPPPGSARQCSPVAHIQRGRG